MKPPIPNSYWVEPGLILAGEHPDAGSEAATRARIEALLGAGVRGFINLTEPGELPDYSGLLPDGVQCHAFPLPDHSVPDTAQQMHEVQDALQRLLAAGLTVYVHCRAGIGRTGITIGCYLREQGQAPEAALSELNRLWQQNARAALSLVDYGYVMENGRIVLDGPATQLAENEDIKEFYLGLNQLGERKSYREVKHYKRRKRWLG